MKNEFICLVLTPNEADKHTLLYSKKLILSNIFDKKHVFLSNIFDKTCKNEKKKLSLSPILKKAL